MSVMIYKAGGTHKMHGLMCDYKTVEADQVDESLVDGWAMSPAEAHAEVTDDPDATETVEIPEDWEALQWTIQVQLAESLTGEPLPTVEGETKAVTAKNTIEYVIAERADADKGE